MSFQPESHSLTESFFFVSRGGLRIAGVLLEELAGFEGSQVELLLQRQGKVFVFTYFILREVFLAPSTNLCAFYMLQVSGSGCFLRC